MREALFSTLGPLDGEVVLDLYAGSGALAIEALSRGAGRALLVERDPRAAAVIRSNLESVGVGEGELTGTRQSGVAAFRFARLPEDADLLERARALAGVLLEADPDLAEPEHALLHLALQAAHGETGRLAIPA